MKIVAKIFTTVTLLSRRSRQREWLSASVLSIRSSLFVCLSVCRQNAKKRDFLKKTKQFRAMISWLFKEPIIGSLKSKMAEIRRLENRHDVIFSAEGGPIWIKFRRLVRNDMSTAVMWSKLKPNVALQYGGRLGEFNGMSSQSYVSHCRVLPLGVFTVTILEPHATL